MTLGNSSYFIIGKLSFLDLANYDHVKICKKGENRPTLLHSCSTLHHQLHLPHSVVLLLWWTRELMSAVAAAAAAVVGSGPLTRWQLLLQQLNIFNK